MSRAARVLCFTGDLVLFPPSPPDFWLSKNPLKPHPQCHTPHNAASTSTNVISHHFLFLCWLFVCFNCNTHCLENHSCCCCCCLTPLCCFPGARFAPPTLSFKAAHFFFGLTLSLKTSISFPLISFPVSYCWPSQSGQAKHDCRLDCGRLNACQLWFCPLGLHTGHWTAYTRVQHFSVSTEAMKYHLIIHYNW